MPSRGAVQNWVERDFSGFAQRYRNARDFSGFAQRYRNARDFALGVMEDELLAMADDVAEDPQRSKLQVDTRKWLLSKRMPAVFGDKIEVNHGLGNIADLLQRLRDSGRLPDPGLIESTVERPAAEVWPIPNPAIREAARREAAAGLPGHEDWHEDPEPAPEAPA